MVSSPPASLLTSGHRHITAVTTADLSCICDKIRHRTGLNLGSLRYN